MAERCGVEGLEFKLRQGRIQWYGHVMRARKMDMVVAGRRPVGSSTIQRQGVQHDKELLGVQENLTIVESGKATSLVQPQ